MNKEESYKIELMEEFIYFFYSDFKKLKEEETKFKEFRKKYLELIGKIVSISIDVLSSESKIEKKFEELSNQ